MFGVICTLTTHSTHSTHTHTPHTLHTHTPHTHSTHTHTHPTHIHTGFWEDSDSEGSDVNLPAVTPLNNEDKDDFDFYG